MLVRKRLPSKAWEWFLIIAIVCVAGFAGSLVLDNIVAFHWAFKDHGEVPIPGSETLYLPAGDVVVSYHYNMPNPDDKSTIPQNLELVITAPSGFPQPSVTDHLGDVSTNEDETYRPVKVAHIPVDGDYTITTTSSVSPSVNPRLAFGHNSPLGFPKWPLLAGRHQPLRCFSYCLWHQFNQGFGARAHRVG